MQPITETEKTDIVSLRALYASWDNTPVMIAYRRQLVGLRGQINKGHKSQKRIIAKFFRDTGLNPHTFLDDVREGRIDLDRVLNDYLKAQASRPELADNSVRAISVALDKLAKALKIPVDLEKIGHTQLKRAPIPYSKDDIKALVEACMNPRDRAMILLLATSGIRIGEISQITVNDVREVLERTTEPYAVYVPSPIAKGGHAYVSFTTEEGATALRATIKRRNLGPTDRVFTKLSETEAIFRRLIYRAKLDNPKERVCHYMRKFCKTALIQYIPEHWAELIIGHGLTSLAKTYDRPTLDTLREWYSKAIAGFSFYGRVQVTPTTDVDLESLIVKKLGELGITGLVELLRTASGQTNTPNKFLDAITKPPRSQ